MTDASGAGRFKRYRHTNKGRYTRHKANAKRRGVEFLLSFDEWWAIWNSSGYYGLKGYSMCRYGDAGPYARGNVYIGSKACNTRDRNHTYGPPSKPRAVPLNSLGAPARGSGETPPTGAQA